MNVQETTAMALPVPPGTSPFRVAGNSYLGTLAFLGDKIPGGLTALFAALHDPALAAFAQQRFLPGSLYDVLPVMPIIETAARLLQTDVASVCAETSRLQVQRDLNGLYRMLLRLASPELLMSRLPRLGRQYFDFVDVMVDQLGPRHYLVRSRGVPELVAPIYTSVVDAYSLTALEYTGARNPRSEWHVPRSAGSRDGVPLVETEREVRWGT